LIISAENKGPEAGCLKTTGNMTNIEYGISMPYRCRHKLKAN
jgi:hypothetical protein